MVVPSINELAAMGEDILMNGMASEAGMAMIRINLLTEKNVSFFKKVR
jgi:hypothetical protein